MKCILLHDIRSLHNIGSIFRSADGAGWDMVYLTGYSATPPRTEISKTALGAEIYVPWEYYANPIHILDILRTGGYTICAIEKNNTSTDIFSTKIDTDICLIM
jgi:tRNA G18 (ribose-2'-O)-methylase SpoU